MSPENPFWCVAILKKLPESFEEGILLAEGFSAESPEDIPADQISYAVMFRTLTSSETLAYSLISESIQSLGVQDENLIEIIILNPKCICRSEKRIISEMNDGDVSMRNLYIGFKSGNAEAQNAALSIVLSAIEKRPWEFWK
jgi:hypothetical protein